MLITKLLCHGKFIRGVTFNPVSLHGVISNAHSLLDMAKKVRNNLLYGGKLTCNQKTFIFSSRCRKWNNEIILIRWDFILRRLQLATQNSRCECETLLVKYLEQVLLGTTLIYSGSIQMIRPFLLRLDLANNALLLSFLTILKRMHYLFTTCTITKWIPLNISSSKANMHVKILHLTLLKHSGLNIGFFH